MGDTPLPPTTPTHARSHPFSNRLAVRSPATATDPESGVSHDPDVVWADASTRSIRRGHDRHEGRGVGACEGAAESRAPTAA